MPETNANPDEKPAATSDTKTLKKNFTQEYVTELREENKTWRLKAADNEKAARDSKELLDKAVNESTSKINEVTHKAHERIVRAELKAVAISHGIVDLDGLKLADLASLKLDDNGEVTGAEELIVTLKKDKPYLFGEKRTSSSTSKAPNKKNDEPKLATEMSPKEYAKAKADAIKKR